MVGVTSYDMMLIKILENESIKIIQKLFRANMQ
jgi:hypothetical protein